MDRKMCRRAATGEGGRRRRILRLLAIGLAIVVGGLGGLALYLLAGAF